MDIIKSINRKTEPSNIPVRLIVQISGMILLMCKITPFYDMMDFVIHSSSENYSSPPRLKTLIIIDLLSTFDNIVEKLIHVRLSWAHFKIQLPHVIFLIVRHFLWNGKDMLNWSWTRILIPLLSFTGSSPQEQ